MPSRFTALRPFVLLFFLIPALLLCAFAGVLCLRHGEVPAGLVNSGVVGGLARRLGVEYHVRSLRVGCLHADCGAGLDASGVHVLLPAFDGLQIDVAGLHVCAAHPLSIQSVRAHVDGGAGLQIGAVDVSAKGTDARDVRFTTTTNSTVAVRQVSMAPPVLSKQTGELTVASIDAAGMDVRLSPAPAAEVCEQTHAALVSSGRLAAATSASIDRLSRAVGRLHRNLIYVALLLPAALFLLKIWVTAWTGQWRRRFVLGAACVLIPLALYALAGALPLARLAVLAFAVSALAGAIMYYVIYRHAPRRYERLEPCAVDVACALIVLPLGAVSFTSMAPRALSSVTIGRVGVADVTLSGSNDSCGQERRFSAAMKSARIDNVAVGLPASARDDTVLSIATVRIPNLSAGVRDGSGATVDAVRIPDAQASADQIQVTLDWKTERIRQIDARLRLRGSAESAALVDELRKVRVLAPIVSGLGATDFDVDVRAAGASTAAAGDLDRFDDVQSTIAVRARVTIDPRQCALTYATAMRVLTPQAKLVASGDGDLSHVEVRSIRSLPGSAVDVGSGSGTLSFGDRPAAHVTLVRLGIARGAARVRMASADASASTAPQCSPVNQSIVVAIAGADVDTGRGARARIARTDARVTRQDASRRQAVSLRTRLDDVHFTVRPSADGAAEIDGSLPAVQLTGRGVSTSELIPQHLDGALDVSIATAADGQIHNTTPLRFRADVWDGSIVVPVQTQVLSQSIVAGLPSDLAFSIAADGRLPSTPSAGDGRIDARVRVPRVPFNSGPVQAELRDLAVSFITGAAGRVSYDSGWNTLTPPPAPKAFCLEDISRFDLATEGQIARWSPPDAIADLQPRLQPCLDGPVVSTERRFRVQGVWPGIKLEGPSGAGIEVRAIDPRIRRADLTGGHLRALELDTDLSGIHTLDGGGDLRIAAHAAIGETATRVSSSLFGTNPVSLADLTLDVTSSRLAVAATQRGETDAIVAAVRPFLSLGGVSLEGITPQARISRLTADVRFDGAAVAGLNGQLEMAPGPVASIAFSPDQPLRTLDLSLAGSDDPTGAAFRVNVDRVANSERASVTVSTDISWLTAHAVDAKGADIRTSLDLHADAHGALHDEPQPPNSIGTKLSTVAGDLARHADHAMQVFGRPPASAASTVDASWNLRLRNAAEGTPLLRVDGGKADLDAAADPATITWRRSNETESSTLSATGTLGAGVTVHDDHLVLDADAPLQLGVALGSQPRRRTDTELALLVAFSDALKPAPATSSGLWDAEYYSRFWSNYTATRAGRARSPLFDSPRIVAGPISVRQITGPVAPLRIAVGHGERLELHAPFSARALFGTANGLVESAVGWRADQASLDSRFTLQLGNIQAGAVGLDLDDGHVPLVEDELDADLAVRTDGLALTREMIARAAAFESPVGLDRIGLALQLHKSARSQAVPGVLQLSTDMQVNTLNKILNIIASDLQMTVPPQTMTYRNIDVNVRVDRGVVTTATPWLTLDGAQILSDPHLALEGTVRLYGGRNGGTLTLDDLLALFIHQ